MSDNRDEEIRAAMLFGEPRTKLATLDHLLAVVHEAEDIPGIVSGAWPELAAALAALSQRREG